MNDLARGQGGQVLRISLTWLLVGVLAMIGLGMLGGMIAGYWWPSTTAPLVPERTQLISTTQEVTISPNTSVTELVARADRSVVLLAEVTSPETITPIATGTMLTNDGLLVTAGTVPSTELVGIDQEGKRLVLERVGADGLFGLTYFRVREGVLPPLDIRDGTVPVGYELQAVARSVPSYTMRVEAFRLAEYVLPPELLPTGIQQVQRGTELSDPTLAGSPLLDDEGRLAGLLLNPEGGLALPARAVQQSLQRVVQAQREYDPWTELGLNVQYTFRALDDTAAQQFVAVVRTVTPNSAAARTLFRRGDVITGIGETTLQWEQSILPLLEEERPLAVLVWRAGNPITLTIHDASAE